MENKFPKGWSFTQLFKDQEIALINNSVWNYDLLPTLETIELGNDFEWLCSFKKYSSFQSSQIKWLEEKVRSYNNIGVDYTSKLKEYQDFLNEFNIQIPVEVKEFLSNPEYNKRIRSNQDCYFEIGDFVERVKFNNQEFFVMHFMSDSQYCILWYICLNKRGEHFIISSPKLYGHFEAKKHNDSLSEATEEYLCANSFKEFLYRYDIENRIWFKSKWYDIKLNDVENNYLLRYKANLTKT